MLTQKEINELEQDKERVELANDMRDVDLKEADDLIGYAMREGLIDPDVAEGWSNSEKLEYYHKCLEMENR